MRTCWRSRLLLGQPIMGHGLLRRLSFSGPSIQPDNHLEFHAKRSANVVTTISASEQTREEIATLRAQVAALQSLVASLQTSNTTLQSQVGSLQTNDTTLQTGDTALQTQVTALQNQLTMAQPVLGLAPFVSVDPNPENGVIGPTSLLRVRTSTFDQS